MKTLCSKVALVMILSLFSALAPSVRGQEIAMPEQATGNVTILFNVAMVIADNDSSSPSARQVLPASMEAAIADLREFLPYKSYRLVDSALTQARSHGRVRLQAAEGEVYTAAFSFREDEKAKPQAFLVDQFSLTLEDPPRADRKLLGPGVAPPPSEQPLVASFRIVKGETVVVGSSRLKGGDRALIVLLTAAR